MLLVMVMVIAIQLPSESGPAGLFSLCETQTAKFFGIAVSALNNFLKQQIPNAMAELLTTAFKFGDRPVIGSLRKTILFGHV